MTRVNGDVSCLSAVICIKITSVERVELFQDPSACEVTQMWTDVGSFDAELDFSELEQ